MNKKSKNWSCLFLLFALWPARGLCQVPERLVSLKPNITQTLVDMGLAGKIVGVTKFCESPNPSVQIVGDYTSFDLEKIVRLKPDLVISSRENASSRDFAKLSELKIPTLLLGFDTWDELLLSLDKLEQHLNPVEPHSTQASFSTRLRAELARVRLLATPLAQKSTVVIVQRTPLMVAGGKSFISTLFSQVGLTNIFADSPTTYPTIDEEVFIREGPDLVFELSHEPAQTGEYLGQKVIPLGMEDYLASPRALTSLKNLVGALVNKLL